MTKLIGAIREHTNAPETRQAMYTEVRSSKHRCRRQAISNTYSECVSVAFVIQHAMCLSRIICGLSDSTVFFHITSYTARFGGKKRGGVCSDFLYNSAC